MAENFASELKFHPDPSFVSQIISGITQGFDIGFEGPERCSVANNMSSATQHKTVIQQYIDKEVLAGRIKGPFPEPPFQFFRCSPIGVTPKKDPNKYRMIMNLSAPKGDSINDSINKQSFSLSYSTVDDAMNIILSLDQGCFLSKLDVEAAFRCVPVKKSQWNLLGFTWENKFYYDTVLTMGGRSSPYIFNVIAEAVQWILVNNYKNKFTIHLLDDFLSVEAPKDKGKALSNMIYVFNLLGIPINFDKVEGPSTCIEFLGITLDTVAMESRLSMSKINELVKKLSLFQGRKKCTQKEMLSLVGSLSFACKVVRAGRSFLAKMIHLAYSVKQLHHNIRISNHIQQDISIWKVFLKHWNGRNLFLCKEPLSYGAEFSTDASGSLGFGGFHSDEWFTEPWSSRQAVKWDIVAKELYPILIAGQEWGSGWGGKRILVSCDNKSTVAAINKGYSNKTLLGTMLRALQFLSMKFNFYLTAKHIPGKQNTLSDLLSRLQVKEFLKIRPSAQGRRVKITQDPLVICKRASRDFC